MGIERKEEYVCDNCNKKFKNGIIIQNEVKDAILSNGEKKYFNLGKIGFTPKEICYCIECYINILKDETKANCIDETMLNVKEQKVIEEVTKKMEKTIDKKINEEVEKINSKESDFRVFKVDIIVGVLASLFFSALFVTGLFLGWHWGWFIGFGIIISGIWTSFIEQG